MEAKQRKALQELEKKIKEEKEEKMEYWVYYLPVTNKLCGVKHLI